VFVFKACPRCRGDIYQDADGELACLQCGHELGRGERAALISRPGVRHLQPGLVAA